MRLLIIGLVMSALIYLPTFILNATLMPQVNHVRNYYENADTIAQNAADGATFHSEN